MELSRKIIMSSGSSLPLNWDPQRPGRERRKRVRHRTESPAFAGMNGNSTGILLDLHQIIDLSEEGMSFQSSAQMEIGESLDFSVDLSEPKTYFHTAGRVVWSNPSGRTGIRFQKTSSEDAAKLRDWLVANSSPGQSPDPPFPLSIENTIAIDSYFQDAPEEPIGSESPSPFRSQLSSLLATEAVKQEIESLAFDLDSALQIIVERALSLTRATGTAIALAAGGDMVCRATSGPDAPPLGTRLQVGSGFSGECVSTGKLLHCDDSEIDPRVDRESCRALDIRSIVAAPIVSRHTVIGLIEIFSPDAGVFSDGDKVVLQNMADIVRDAVERAVEGVRGPDPKPSANQTPAENPMASVGSARQARHKQDRDELVRRMAESVVAPIASPSPVAVATTLKSAKIPWLVVAAIVAGVLVALWMIVAGWSNAAKKSDLPRSVSQASADLNHQVEMERNTLPDLKDLAVKGDKLAQFTLGLRYATGSDAPQDYGEAARWFTLAADQGHVLAQSTLGAYYWAGRGVPQDFRKAYYWALLAQAAGDDASRARVPFLVPRLSHEDMVAVQHQAGDWIRQHRASGKPAAARN